MTDEPLASVVATAGLDPDALVAHAPLPDGDQVWALRSTGDGWFDDWQRMRALVPQTGRWPLAMMSWGHDVDVLNRRGIDPVTGRDEGPAAILRRLDDVDVDAALDTLEAESLPLSLDEWFDYHEEATRRRCGSAPTLEELRAGLGDEPLELQIERWLLHWELTAGGLTARPDGEVLPVGRAVRRRAGRQLGHHAAARGDAATQHDRGFVRARPVDDPALGRHQRAPRRHRA